MENSLIGDAHHEMMGIILLRHVTSDKTNRYWNHSVRNIRECFGPDVPIVIIDDHSDDRYLHTEVSLHNVTVVDSTYHGRGEILPYYYFYKYKWFHRAILIHDSIFFQAHIDTSHIDDIVFLWHFEHDWDNPDEERRLMMHLDHSEDLLRLYDEKEQWKGAFGSMSIVTHSFVARLEQEYKIFRLLDHIHTRSDRMCFERIVALLATSLVPHTRSLLGCIHDYMPWGVEYDTYQLYPALSTHLPIVKVWTGR